MKVRIKKLHPDAIIPQYAKAGDAGLDFTATSVEVTPEYVEYGTGLAVEVPEGHVGLMFPRSSVSKKDLLLCNSVGVIDSGYRGEIKFRFKRVEMANRNYNLNFLGIPSLYLENEYELGDKVGQLIIMPYPQIELEEVEELDESERGTNGFGSSGK